MWIFSFLFFLQLVIFCFKILMGEEHKEGKGSFFFSFSLLFIISLSPFLIL